MAAKTRDMTSGNPTRLILSFCLPIMAGNLFQQLYSLVDSLVIGQVEGVTALAAVSAAGWLDWTVLGLAMGSGTVFSMAALAAAAPSCVAITDSVFSRSTAKSGSPFLTVCPFSTNTRPITQSRGAYTSVCVVFSTRPLHPTVCSTAAACSVTVESATVFGLVAFPPHHAAAQSVSVPTQSHAHFFIAPPSLFHSVKTYCAVFTVEYA